MLSDENSQRYVRSLYPVALLLICVPLADLVLRTLPPQFGSLQWRFTSIGLLIGNYGTIILGFGLLGLVAALTGNRTVLRVLGFVSLAMAVVSLALVALFVLDAVQMRQVVTANFKRTVLTAALGAMFTAVFGTVAFIMMGRAALAASRRGPLAAAPRRAAASPLVVAGQGASDTV